VKAAENDRRSRMTRKLLGDALVSLILEKGYDSTTVVEIAERANVGRSTFYAHFYDKEDLFRSEFEELIRVLGSRAAHMEEEGGALVPSLELFRHIQEHHRLYRALIWGRGIDFLYKTGQAALINNIEARLRQLHPGKDEWQIPLPILSNYVAGAFLALLRWWLDNNVPSPPEQMHHLFQQLVMPGVRASLQMNGTGVRPTEV
jgi:AcrR family transcriptional regulator